MSAEADTETDTDDAIVIERGGGGPITAHDNTVVLEFQRGIEEVLARGETVEPQELRDYSERIFDFIRRDIVLTLAWPSTWYIPTQADYRNYWITEPPVANRYAFGWGESRLYPPPNALSGSAATGAVFSYTSLNPSDSHDTAFAGVAALFRPSA